jgi:hypothetical protein
MRAAEPRPLPGTTPHPLYPGSDEGMRTSETDFHVVAVLLLRQALEDHLAGRHAYVASHMQIFFWRGNLMGQYDPDLMVVLGVSGHPRRDFRTWEEGTVPNVVFEIVSRKTCSRDRISRRTSYEQVGASEYCLFDPEGGLLTPPLQGFSLAGQAYQPLVPEADGSLVSSELGLRLVPEGHMLRLVDLQTGAPILTRKEQIEKERRRANDLAAEAARLRAALGQAPPEP